MSRMTIRLALLLVAVLLSGGCGYGSRNYMTGNGMPAITQLNPAETMSNGPAFNLTVIGTGFGTDSIVYWGTGTRMTTYVSATQVTAQITAADIMDPGMVQVYVHTGGANSTAVTFTIQ